MTSNPFIGKWSYRSFYNIADLNTDLNKLELGNGTIDIREVTSTVLGGTIGGATWQLNLHGSFGYGSPMQVAFQGEGVVNGEKWIYGYIGWLVPAWPNSNSSMQVNAIVGSVTRVIAHSSSGGGVSPAGVVGSFFAVQVS
jgi:hypothetical protein